jgi:hypothetical protein
MPIYQFPLEGITSFTVAPLKVATYLLSGMIALFCTGLGRLLLAFPSRRTIASHVNWALGVALGLALAAFLFGSTGARWRALRPWH